MGLQELQKGLEDALRQLLASPAPSIQEQIVPTLAAALPQAIGSEGSTPSRLQSSLVLPSLRSRCIQLTQEAIAAQQPPLQYCLPGAAWPAIPRLMQVAIVCQERKLLEASHVLQILEDVQDLVSVEHSLDIITWLEQHRAMLLSSYKQGQQQLIRLCNCIHKRLGKHDVIQRARLLMLTANCAHLFDRSGANVTAAFAPADPPTVEEVPADAVDSAGKPVDSTLYTAFWKLQPLIQEPIKVLKSASEWDNLQAHLGTVLDGLAKSKATVAAVHAAGSSALTAGDKAAAAGGSSELYLSSYKLFGLQLADSAFRRGFLVQVLILLRTLLLPGKQPTDTLKDKARMQAVALEGRVYKLLEETPHHGREFARAVKEVLRREATWVEWKKGKNLVLRGQPQVPPPAAGEKAAAGDKKPPQGCNGWELPQLASLSAAVGQHQAKQQQESRKRKATVEDGLQLKAKMRDLSKDYDWQGATIKEKNLGVQPSDMLTFLGGAGESNLTYWAQEQVENGTAMHPRPLMEGLKVSDQDRYPITERVCSQLVREMNPELDMEGAPKRVMADPVYRWRIGRAVAQEAPKYEGSLVTAEGLEEGMMEEQMPKSLHGTIPQPFKDRYNAKKAEEAAKKAEEAAKKKKTGQPQQQKPAPKAKTPAGAAAAAAAAAAGGEDPAAAGAAAAAAAGGGEDGAAAADGDAAAAVKQEPAESVPPGVEETEADAAAAGDDDPAGGGGGGGLDVVKQEADATAAATEAAAAALAALEAGAAAGAAAAAIEAELEEGAAQDLAGLAADGMDVDQQGS